LPFGMNRYDGRDLCDDEGSERQAAQQRVHRIPL
jgi:hypothetical protein